MRDLLESQGWRVEVAEGGAAALHRLAVDLFDALVLDLHMPEVDGVDVVRAIHGGEVRGPKRLVVVTADPVYAVREDLLSLGVHCVLTKPVDITVLLQVLDGDDGAVLDARLDVLD